MSAFIHKMPIKYIVIVCDDCANDQSRQQLQKQMKNVFDQVSQLKNKKDNFL